MQSPSSLAELNVGPLLVFTFVNAILYGMLCVQCHFFLQQASQNARKPVVMISVWVLWFLATAHLVLALHVCYWYCVSNFGNLEAVLLTYPWSAGVTFFIALISNLIVQGWFIFRVWILSKKSLIIAAVTTAFVIIATGLGIALASVVMATTDLTRLARFNWLIIAFNTTDIAANFVLTAVLCTYYIKFRTVSLRRTRSFVNMLIMTTVNTGLLGLMVAACTMIVRFKFPDSIIFFADYLPYSQVYANALLASLNARELHWFRSVDKPVVSIPLSNLSNLAFSTGPKSMPDGETSKYDEA